MFQLKLTGGPYGDATSDYNVIFDRKYTVKEFVQEALSDTNLWGDIRIRDDSTDFLKAFGLLLCEYSHGKLLDRDRNRNGWYSEFLDKSIRSATAHGGWTCMDYMLELEE